MFDPMIRMQSLLIRSRGGLVQAPNPKVGESAATVVEWQYLSLIHIFDAILSPANSDAQEPAHLKQGVPMIYNERDLREAQALDIAQKMLVAARTAPKGKGIDVLECAVVNGDERCV